MIDEDSILYPKQSISKLGSTLAESEHSAEHQVVQKNGMRDSKQGQLKKGGRDMERLNKENSSCK